MGSNSSLVFAGIAPHPPIMVPEVGREAIVEVRSSIDAMADLTDRVVRSGAETVVLISPHAPLKSDAFVAYDGPVLHANFATFRAPKIELRAELDDDLLNEITHAAAAEHLSTVRIKRAHIDHGTSVPLYFLQRNGWNGKVIALGYSFLSKDDHVRYGRCIRHAIEQVARPVAFIASGDLSHRLKVEAPAGYQPNAHLFDEEVVAAIRDCESERIIEIDPELRRLAGECGYRSMLVALGVAGQTKASCEVISYEAPFGVGYLVAQLLNAQTAKAQPVGASLSPDTESANLSSDTESGYVASADEYGRALPALARRVVELLVTTGQTLAVPPDISDLLRQHAACFVSIKTRSGELRGCIGTIDPVKETLGEEIILNAVSAATRDPRFSPIREDELAGLKYSVDVLSAPEPATLADLDPQIYGVIVADENGWQRGLLLPNLAGITTATHQVEVASGKAGIRGKQSKLFRFRADRYSE
jgi:MEMO1 family protein